MICFFAALFCGPTFDRRSNLGHTLAQVASVCQFFLVDTWRRGSRGRARAESSAAADYHHMVVEHSREDGKHRDFLTLGD
jgi:hypothetical protein